METLEPKKLALIRIWQILKEYSDEEHPLTQSEIARHLENDYRIVIERKAISRNLSLLKEVGVEIASDGNGSYLECREFEDSELHMLIDGILCSNYITATHSEDLIERICGLSNKYFKSSVKYIYSVKDWNKSENQSLFYNIEVISSAIEKSCQICYDYNKYKSDKKLHKSSEQTVSPYQMILHNQKYYLMARSERWGDITFHRLDRITNIKILDQKSTPIRKNKGYEDGIDFRRISTAMPYLYTDTPERINFIADEAIIDQVIDWFGKNITITESEDEKKVNVSIIASPSAMEHWAMQYANHVEVTAPESLRTRIRESLEKTLEKYK